jgi:hypothetical protein
LLDRQFGVAVLVLLALAVGGGWLAYDAYAQPDTTVEQREVTVWEPGGEFTHRATVIDNESKTAGVFEPDETVGNRSFYYLGIMPELSGQFGFGYAADAGDLDVTVDRRLVIRSVGEQREGTTEYWRQTRALGSTNRTLAPGERLRMPFAVNVSDAVATADRVRERLGDPGQTQVSVNVTVTVAGTAGGQAVDRTLRYALPVTVEGDLYRVDDGGGSRAFTRTERTVVEQPPGPLPAYGGPALLGLGLLGLAGLAYARSDDRLALTGAERAWLDYRDDRADFDDWISTIRLPEEARGLPVAEADSLADLVDFAIDTDNAVLESPDGSTYHVVHDGYRYTFEAPAAPADAAVGEQATGGDGDDDPPDGDGAESTDADDVPAAE